MRGEDLGRIGEYWTIFGKAKAIIFTGTKKVHNNWTEYEKKQIRYLIIEYVATMQNSNTNGSLKTTTLK